MKEVQIDGKIVKEIKKAKKTWKRGTQIRLKYERYRVRELQNIHTDR